MRSSAFTVAGFGSSQVIRLASNLILARLLFPEAFGLMALVSVILQGLMQFSDVGVTPAILQSRRGDDEDFLNTAWTIQVMRGVGLWLTACALGLPMAWFYGEPRLALMLPVAGLSLILTGLNPTALDTANRHLNFGRVTAIDIAVQVVGVVTGVALAWITGSVWALIASGVLAALANLILLNLFLPGIRNRFRWEPAAAQELVTFGKWIFLATVCGFLWNQADKILIGKYLPLDVFGVYNIGYFLASFPLLLGGMITRRLLIPIYRELPPSESRENFLKLRQMRTAVTGGLLALLAVFALGGVPLVDLLYDDRYAMAGAVVSLVAVIQIPQVIVLTYDQAALAAGDSRRFFVLTLAKAAAMILCLIAGLELAGLLGAILGLGAAMILVYPVVVWLARRMGAWDGPHDAIAALIGIALAVVVALLNLDHILALAAL
ncbi:oligosaccharide flippase family protein [Aquicoccus sp. SCR17]|nr:oligosaccharide flippase family protein [Carideicomes alvinocaridis]